MRHLPILSLLLSLPALLCAQVEPQAQQALEHVFDRPAGTTIQQAQKDKLAAWLQEHEGKDLGDCGYAKALQRYLDRDYSGAVAALDEFFAKGHKIASEEHRTMAGRVFLNALSQEARADQPDLDKLCRWGEGMTRLYQDTAMLVRMATTIGPRLRDPAAFRIALAKGVFASDLSAAKKDAFLQGLYQAGAAADGAAPAAGRVAVAGRALAMPAAGDQNKGLQPGQVVEAFAVDRVVNGPTDFDLTRCKGKVVVLDFFASWCPPCRAAVPGMVALQRQYPDDLQVIGVTRYYGNGMDFSAEGAKAPHDGKSVQGLDREQEGALYAPLVKAFAINYPIVFSADQELAKTTFGVTGIPTMCVIGRDGKLVGKVVGAGDAKHKELLDLVEKARK